MPISKACQDVPTVRVLLQHMLGSVREFRETQGSTSFNCMEMNE